MHSKIIALAVAGSSASAFVLPRDDGCSFEVTASGGKSGTVGQLGDGQNRIGGSFAPATYHISNSGITDANGRGCILTPPTTQWQCDVGATPTTGFSISSSGEIEYNGSGTFYACGATDTEYNIYTVPVKDQKNCVEVTLSSGGKCTGNGSGGGASSSSPPKPTKPTETEKSTAPAPWTEKPTPSASWNETETWPSTEKPSLATTSPVRLTTSTVYTTTVDTITSCAATVTDCLAESQSTVLVTKTIAVSTTVCPVTETEKTPPASWESKPSPPATWESKPSPLATWESKPAPSASYESKPWAPASQESKPAPPASQQSKPAPPSTQESKPARPATQESKPAPPASYESKPWASASAPAPSAPAPSAPAASAPAVSAPAASPSAPAECQATTVYVTVTKEAPLPVVVPSTNASPQGPASSAAPSPPAESSKASAPPAGSSKASPPPAATAPSSKSPPSGTTAKPVASSPATPVAHGSACPTSLTGAYQTPHLIVPISSEHPDWAYGTSYNGQINSTTSTIFNFDIPQDYKGKQCSIVFLFPSKKDLETSSYEFGGSGSLDVTELSTAASQKTSWSNAPSVKKDLGSIALQSGNSYVVATSDCQAGTTQSIELSSKGGLSLNFFEDYNPSPLGLYITSC